MCARGSRFDGRARHLADRAREQIREHAFGLNDAAIAEARLARSLRQTVDEGHGSAARLKRERRRDADNSGAKHDDVDSIRGHGMAVSLTGRVPRATARPAQFRLPFL